MNHRRIPHPWAALLCLCLTTGIVANSWADDHNNHNKKFRITSANWKDSDAQLKVKGKGKKHLSITVSNADTGAIIGSDEVNDKKWKVEEKGLSSVPCRVRAVQSDGQSDERKVKHAPANCDDGSGSPQPPPPSSDASVNSGADDDDGGDSPQPPPPPTPIPPPPPTPVPPPSGDASVNSTSQNGIPGNRVPEQALAGNNLYKVFATNDLGMHCGDLDTRISSILPPFNVLHAMVIRRGGEPNIMTRADGIDVVYSAAANPNDPVLTGLNSAGTGPVLSSLVNGKVYKTNFWDIAPGQTEPTALAAYRAFYPPNILDAFYPNGGADIQDLGLPAPNNERLWLGDGTLTAEQQEMPGRVAPYVENAPKSFQLFTVDQPFFVNFPFGYTINNVKWFEAAGIPMTAFDDAGRENPWPLMRVQAKDSGGSVLASLDTVLPISGESNCGACHNAVADGGNGAAVRNLSNIALSIDDPQMDTLPQAISLEYAADLNLVRLHDQKHGTTLEANGPVVCQSCHYSPALDLAQVGPKGPADADGNGRQQTNVKTMSNVMHSHHAEVTDGQGNKLFPTMPPAVDANGNLRDPVAANQILQDSCYQCHPGRRTDCLRGAMASGGMLCQDCHGNMAQVGNDFSRQVTPATPGQFELAGDFYTNPATPRVPWANEPGCGACHSGDAMDNLHANADTLGSPRDGIRLMQAYRIGDAKATPIVPSNKRFAENTTSNGNPALYRVSKGHKGVFCEACHGATHGIWPNKNPLANDNLAAEQLQGHAGVVIECSTCHTGDLGITLEGPHGMHPVGSAGNRFADGGHEDLAEHNPNACRACHGQNGEGTVLSTMHQDRLLNTDDNGAQLFSKGHQVTCHDCHENKL